MIVLEIYALQDIGLGTVLVTAHTHRVVLVGIVGYCSGRRYREVAEYLVFDTKFKAFVFGRDSAHGVVHERVEFIVVEAGALHAVPHAGVETGE